MSKKVLEQEKCVGRDETGPAAEQMRTSDVLNGTCLDAGERTARRVGLVPENIKNNKPRGRRELKPTSRREDTGKKREVETTVPCVPRSGS